MVFSILICLMRRIKFHDRMIFIVHAETHHTPVRGSHSSTRSGFPVFLQFPAENSQMWIFPIIIHYKRLIFPCHLILLYTSSTQNFMRDIKIQLL